MSFKLKINSKPKPKIQQSVLKPKNPFTKNTAKDLSATKKFSVPTKKLYKAKRNCVKALEQDSTIFQYDEIYDEIKNKNNQRKNSLKSDSKNKNKKVGTIREGSKYIAKLKATMIKRNLEKDMAFERVQAREREKTDFLYKDKPVLITPAYKKVLDQRKRLKKEIEQEEIVNKAKARKGDQDVLRFQRNLFEEKLGVNKRTDKKEERDKDSTMKGNEGVKQRSDNVVEYKDKKDKNELDKEVDDAEKIETKRKETERMSKKAVWKKRFGMAPKTKFSQKKKDFLLKRRNGVKEIAEARKRYLERKKSEI